MTKRDTIIQLARTLRDVTGTDTITAGHSGRPESRALQLSDLYKAGSYAALEQALTEMRRPPSFLGTYMHHGHPLAALERDFTRRYITSTRKPLPARQTGTRTQVLVNGNWRTPNPTTDTWWPCGGLYRIDLKGPLMVQVETWTTDARYARWELATDWLEAHLPRVWLPDWNQLSERAA